VFFCKKRGRKIKNMKNSPGFGALLAPFSCYTESITRPIPGGEKNLPGGGDFPKK
jgi:hypothetical protein